MFNRITLLVVAILLNGCAISRIEETPEQTALLDGLVADVEVGDAASTILYLPEDIRTALDTQIPSEWNMKRRFRQLQRYLFEGEGHDIQYAASATLTAAETLARGEGNCLSISNAFVAAARHLDIDAKFQTVEVRPTWGQEAGTMIRYEHIVAIGQLGSGGRYVVDFLPEFSDEDRPRDVISDQRALALYHNNLGAESVIEGDVEGAVQHILRAIKIWPTNSNAWNNLGTAYRRLDELQLAELSFKRALKLDRNNYSALANLTQFYISNDRAADAEQYLKRVNRYYQRNPYFHYYMARLTRSQGLYEDTLTYLKTAVRLKKDDPEFYRALADTYLRLGDEDEALKMAERARVVVPQGGRQRTQRLWRTIQVGR